LSNEEKTNDYENFEKGMIYMKILLMVFSATFNNISVISWPSISLVRETGGPGENHR
jgi:hypothetical protein